MVNQNKSILQPTKYTVAFHRIPDMVYFCQAVTLPGVYLDTIQSPTPLANLKIPSNKINFNNFNISFLVDIDLHSWLGIYNWITDLAPSMSTNQYKQMIKKEGIYSQASLIIHGNDGTPFLRVKMYNAFPTSLSSINFTVSPGEEEVLLAEASFAFTTQEIEKISA